MPEAELVPYDPWADVGKPLSTLEAVSGTASGPDIPGPPAPSTSTAHTTGAANESAHTQTSDQPVFAPAAAAATAAAAAEGFLPEWSTAMKGGNVSVRSPLLAEVTGNTFKVSTTVLSSQPIASTTTASTLYFEVTIAGPGKAKGDVLHSGTFIGLVAHTRTTSARVHSSRGVWGLRATCDHNALRLNGQSGGAVVGNAKGYSFGYGERVGMLIDRENCTAQLFREGVQLEGAMLQLRLRDFSFETFRLVVDLCGFVGTSASISVPETVPTLVASAEAIDELQSKVMKLEAQLGGATTQKLQPTGVSWLVGGEDDSSRAAPSWSLVHTAFHALLEAKQQALLQGKPVLRPNGHATLSWNLTVERSAPVRSFLQACGKASRKNLLCGGTVVKFVGEDGVDKFMGPDRKRARQSASHEGDDAEVNTQPAEDLPNLGRETRRHGSLCRQRHQHQASFFCFARNA